MERVAAPFVRLSREPGAPEVVEGPATSSPLVAGWGEPRWHQKGKKGGGSGEEEEGRRKKKRKKKKKKKENGREGNKEKNIPGCSDFLHPIWFVFSFF